MLLPHCRCFRLYLLSTTTLLYCYIHSSRLAGSPIVTGAVFPPRFRFVSRTHKRALSSENNPALRVCLSMYLCVGVFLWMNRALALGSPLYVIGTELKSVSKRGVVKASLWLCWLPKTRSRQSSAQVVGLSEGRVGGGAGVGRVDGCVRRSGECVCYYNGICSLV